MSIPSYSTGTVAIGAGDTVIAGNGTIWSGVNARAGDDIVVAGHTVIVADVIDPTHLAIDPWPYPGVPAGAAYKIVQRSPLRFAGGQAMADVSTLIAALNTQGLFVIVGIGASAPDPSLGEEDQFALQPSTFKLWLKTGGAWLLQGTFKGFNVKGPWNSVTSFNINDVVSQDGSSYVAIAPSLSQPPPNATYWALQAAGTVRLAAIVCSDNLTNYRPDEALKYATAVPGNSVKTWYSTTAIATAAPWRWLARLRWPSLTTAGTWTAPDIVELLGPKSMMPGDVVQRLNMDTQTVTATTSSTFQITSVTKDIALSSAANLVQFSWNATLRTNNGIAADVIAQLHRGGTAIGRPMWVDGPSGTTVAGVGGANIDFPNTTSTTTYMVKIKNDDNATTVSINPNGSAGSSMTLEEIMA